MAACENTNTGRGAILNKKQIPPGAALFGFSHLYGGIPGGQAEPQMAVAVTLKMTSSGS